RLRTDCPASRSHSDPPGRRHAKRERATRAHSPGPRRRAARRARFHCARDPGRAWRAAGRVLWWAPTEGALATTLVTNASIFDGSGAAPYTGDVLVDGRRIAAVARGGGLARQADRVIDGAGATLMPGLVEPHGHVSYPDAATNADFTRLPPEEHVLVTMRNAQLMLDSGSTNVMLRAPWDSRGGRWGRGPTPPPDVGTRTRIAAGRTPGPRYPANGPEIPVTGGLGDTTQPPLPHHETPTFAWVADGPDEIRR